MKLASEQERRNTQKWIEHFQEEYDHLKTSPLGDDHPLKRSGELEGLLGQIEDFRQQILEFERQQEVSLEDITK